MDDEDYKDITIICLVIIATSSVMILVLLSMN